MNWSKLKIVTLKEAWEETAAGVEVEDGYVYIYYQSFGEHEVIYYQKLFGRLKEEE